MNNINPAKADNTGDRLIRLNEVMSRTALGRTSLYVMAKRGDFPKQVKLGPRAAAWSEAAVSAWIEARKRSAPEARAA